MKNLSDQHYWEEGYQHRTISTPLPDLEDFRETPTRRVVETIESVDLTGKSVLEVGAGDSTVLLTLATRKPDAASFSGLDYTDKGCDLLKARVRSQKLRINVIKADLFNPPNDLEGQFDVVYSIGLVEHFVQLEDVLSALARFLTPSGVLISIIPNMHGVLGTLTRHWNRAVYDIHNPHGLNSFLSGHEKAGLAVLRSGLLCSTNFGVLSSCFSDPRVKGRQVYVQLSRLSKLLWLFESRCFELPKTAWLSPFIYAVSRPRLPGSQGVTPAK